MKKSKFEVLCECETLVSPALPGSPSPDLLPLYLTLMFPESFRNFHTFVPSPLWILLPGSSFPHLANSCLTGKAQCKCPHDISSNDPPPDDHSVCFASIGFSSQFS